METSVQTYQSNPSASIPLDGHNAQFIYHTYHYVDDCFEHTESTGGEMDLKLIQSLCGTKPLPAVSKNDTSCAL